MKFRAGTPAALVGSGVVILAAHLLGASLAVADACEDANACDECIQEECEGHWSWAETVNYQPGSQECKGECYNNFDPFGWDIDAEDCEDCGEEGGGGGPLDP